MKDSEFKSLEDVSFELYIDGKFVAKGKTESGGKIEITVEPNACSGKLIFMDNEYDAIGLLGGTLTANANVIQRDFTTVTNVTYVMLAQITVPSGLTLDIQQGIVIKSPSSMMQELKDAPDVVVQTFGQTQFIE